MAAPPPSGFQVSCPIIFLARYRSNVSMVLLRCIDAMEKVLIWFIVLMVWSPIFFVSMPPVPTTPLPNEKRCRRENCCWNSSNVFSDAGRTPLREIL